jgi:toxin ParE1/3/4
MKYSVYFIQEAEDDFFDIYRYIVSKDGRPAAEKVYSGIQRLCVKLETFPRMGHKVRELERIGISEYLEIRFKPYRLIYTLDSDRIYIHAVLDCRRDVAHLLESRLLR